MQQQTRAAWRRALSTVQVGGGSAADLTTFYTALYHSMQFPSVFNDVDGRYMGFDDKVHQVPAGQTQYATFSDWDTYRALAPLQAMLFPKQAGDMANSLIRDAQQQGDWMPRWPLANVSTTGTMDGDNSVPLIANTVAFGGRNVNIADVLPIMLKGANHSQQLGWGWQERQCVEEYVQLGYAPNDACSQGAHRRQGVSETLEWSTDDFAISQLAAAIGDKQTAAQYQQRSQNWQNTFNPTTGYLEPRDDNGAFPNGPAFVTPPANAFGQDGYDEGNAADYGWEVPQNMAGLIAAMGGKTPRSLAWTRSSARTTPVRTRRTCGPATRSTSPSRTCTTTWASRGRRRHRCASRSRIFTRPRRTGCPATTTSARCRPGTCGRRLACSRSLPDGPPSPRQPAVPARCRPPRQRRRDQHQRPRRRR